MVENENVEKKLIFMYDTIMNNVRSQWEPDDSIELI